MNADNVTAFAHLEDRACGWIDVQLGHRTHIAFLLTAAAAERRAPRRGLDRPVSPAVEIKLGGQGFASDRSTRSLSPDR
ncbi:hypothetical protein [Lentzea flaviverrucosa]|uniref:hypothetical protein n=1 Tax=Lentzea flaviverrucosa TaxID=200379 RepID=UPI000E0C432F|nr:hypothetical protein [Lentzea flaviverrucosa]